MKIKKRLFIVLFLSVLSFTLPSLFSMVSSVRELSSSKVEVMRASINGNCAVLQRLLDGGSIGLKEINVLMFLYPAIENGHPGCVQIILDWGESSLSLESYDRAYLEAREKAKALEDEEEGESGAASASGPVNRFQECADCIRREMDFTILEKVFFIDARGGSFLSGLPRDFVKGSTKLIELLPRIIERKELIQVLQLSIVCDNKYLFSSIIRIFKGVINQALLLDVVASPRFSKQIALRAYVYLMTMFGGEIPDYLLLCKYFELREKGVSQACVAVLGRRFKLDDETDLSVWAKENRYVLADAIEQFALENKIEMVRYIKSFFDENLPNWMLVAGYFYALLHKHEECAACIRELFVDDVTENDVGTVLLRFCKNTDTSFLQLLYADELASKISLDDELDGLLYAGEQDCVHCRDFLKQNLEMRCKRDSFLISDVLKDRLRWAVENEKLDGIGLILKVFKQELLQARDVVEGALAQARDRQDVVGTQIVKVLEPFPENDS